MFKKLEDYLTEAPVKTKTDVKTDNLSGLDDLLKSKPVNAPATVDEPSSKEKSSTVDPRTRASAARTARATQNITPTDQMRDLLNRMQDIEGLDQDEPEILPDVQVDVDTLPAVAQTALRAAGVQYPEFHQVANLPGNMSRAIRTLGKMLFRAFTRTPTTDIWMIGNVNDQGPNTTKEVNAVAGWIVKNGYEVTGGDIDFEGSIPGYTADIRQYSAAGIRWLLVRDQFGDYIYSWPEDDSVEPVPSLTHKQ